MYKIRSDSDQNLILNDFYLLKGEINLISTLPSISDLVLKDYPRILQVSYLFSEQILDFVLLSNHRYDATSIFRLVYVNIF